MSNTKPPELPRREQIPENQRWRLEDLYATEEAWEADFQRLQAAANEAR